MLKLRNLLIALLLGLTSFLCFGCDNETEPKPEEIKASWEKRDFEGVVLYRRVNSSYKPELSQEEILESLNNEIQKNHLIKDTDLILSLTLGRLTIAGETHSMRELQAITKLAMNKAEVNEIISTAIITGEGENIL